MKERPLRILLVEDDDDDVVRFRKLAGVAAGEAASASIEVAVSVAEALGRLAAEAYDVVVTDYRLGAEDGLALVREARARGMDAPIVLLTGHGDEELAAAAIKAGATDYLAKAKLTAESLGRVLRLAMELAEQQRLRSKAEEALRRSEEQLREARRLETIATLAGGIAHEFNSLLNVVLVDAQRLSGRLPPGDPLRRSAERIRAAGERAADLTRRLLAFSRQQVLQMRVLDLNPLVCAQQGPLRSLVGESIVLLARPGPALGLVKADPQQVLQVLESLASNAREAMPEGGTLLVETANAELDEVRAFRHESFVQAGPYVMLAVTDTGRGMDEETQSRIFEPFFTTKSRAEAPGLGLSSVYGIVKQSGGYVWVYSEPGRGTAVKVYLPRVDEDGKPWTGSAASEGPGGTETVLVVDDDAPLREAVCDALAERGFHVLSAPAGPEALDVAETHPGPVHLLLTDVVLPVMTGCELADRLCAARPETRVLYMSGFAEHVAVRQGVFAAGRPLLEKPFTSAALAQMVRHSLDAAPRDVREAGSRVP